MIGWLNPCEYLPMWSIQRVNKTTAFIIGILPGRRINSIELVGQQLVFPGADR
jgi:hypothetical protein